MKKLHVALWLLWLGQKVTNICTIKLVGLEFLYCLCPENNLVGQLSDQLLHFRVIFCQIVCIITQKNPILQYCILSNSVLETTNHKNQSIDKKTTTKDVVFL